MTRRDFSAIADDIAARYFESRDPDPNRMLCLREHFEPAELLDRMLAKHGLKIWHAPQDLNGDRVFRAERQVACMLCSAKMAQHANAAICEPCADGLD